MLDIALCRCYNANRKSKGALRKLKALSFFARKER